MLMMLAVLVLMMQRAAADARDVCWFGFVRERAEVDHMMLAVLGLMTERAATDAYDACWFGFVLERAAVDAHGARCFGEAHDGTCCS